MSLTVDITKANALRLMLAGLCASGLACSERLLPAVSGNDGGQETRGVPADPTDGWQIFSVKPDNELDLLFVIDNSPSMAPLQNKLVANIPVFMNILKALPMGLPDIHVAVISSNTGAGEFDLPQINCGYQGDQGLFQIQPRGNCATSPLPSGQTFLQASGNQAQTNYTGDISDALSCIAALGEGGCGFEGQLKSLRWALDTNPNDADPAPAGTMSFNSGFLRPEAYLAVILFTNEDDCSVPTSSDLIDPTQTHMSDPLGPLWSFRCNEFGHLCDINGTLQHPVRGVNTDLMGCVSNDTPSGKETKVADEIAFLKSLKSDPSRILVAAITGPPAPYSTNMINQTLPDGSMELQPNTLHSCAQNSGEYADPAIRIQQWVQGFGSNGLLQTICADSFAPALTTVASALSEALGPQCVPGPFVIDPTTSQPECRVVDRNVSPSTGQRVDTVILNCAAAMANPPCWTLSNNTGDCEELVVYRGSATVPLNLETAITCQPCPVGQSEIGCP